MNRDDNTPLRSNGRIRYGPDMRVLIVGGGIAGLTLCGLLQQRGFHPTLVERAPEFGDVGYVIVVWPSGSQDTQGAWPLRAAAGAGLRLYQLQHFQLQGQGYKQLHD